MSVRLSKLESLARDICWAGFLYPRKVGRTKAEYWRDITPEARQDYRNEAKRTLWLLERLGVERFNSAREARHK